MSSERNPLLVDNEHGDVAGLRTGMREAIQAAGPLLPLREVEQLGLLGDDPVLSTQLQAMPRGRGRPAGARNKQTRDVRSYLLSRYSHPLETLAQIYSRPVDVLSAELGCSKKEAAFLQVRAAAEVLPYVEGKMPQAISLDVNGDFNLLIPGVNISAEDARAAGDGEFVLADAYADFVEVGDESAAT